MPAKDPERRRKTWREWYGRNKKTQMARVKKQGQRNREEVQRYKSSKPCADCQKSYPHYVMDFDHVRGKKIDNVADIMRVNMSRKKLWDEIAKCDLVCSNCHRARTHKRRLAAKRKTKQRKPSAARKRAA